eukprot:CAMPEP_0177221120 /NCGR_PEP_ID=MMETSP0367-20130122/37247_1 /TAXON_ID=447022 ORGANISM="Scrippsiella hangoei-like, Strain SHHI-4" /NCGR_SAMPLE_ID=MMETSP0367 /ASSEMBLY_ACC=CAM_ASM_000362 /LENGTH=73 /DNA_ID=CAMNT_0018670933 /DNA_START=444 /DNA_END=665 /DNA_ORIENTATION=+
MMNAEGRQELYAVSCKAKVPNLAFCFKDFDLCMEDLVLDRVGNKCVLGLQSIDVDMGMPMWILGGVFMRKYYV